MPSLAIDWWRRFEFLARTSAWVARGQALNKQPEKGRPMRRHLLTMVVVAVVAMLAVSSSGLATPCFDCLETAAGIGSRCFEEGLDPEWCADLWNDLNDACDGVCSDPGGA